MIKRAILGGCLLVTLASPVVAQSYPQGTTYYDAVGRPVGSSTNYGQGTTYYDAVGRPVGSSTNYGYQEERYNSKPVQAPAEIERQVRRAYGLPTVPSIYDLQ